MKFRLIRASQDWKWYPNDDPKEYVEINTLEDLEKLEKELNQKESTDVLENFPCNLIVDFIREEITYYDYWIE